MEIKIQCGCGARYSFDVEPVNGQMPVTVNCPQCGADGTAQANEIIAQAMQPVSPPTTARLRVAGSAAAPAQATGEPTAAETVPCNRHHRMPAVSECVVCHKPICSECMAQFGYLCSIHCRYRAEQQGIKVPVYEGQRLVALTRWRRKVGLIVGLIVLCIAAVIGAWIWYEFVGSEPRLEQSLKFADTDAPIFARFVDRNRVLLLNSKNVVLRDLKQRRDIWTAPWNTEPKLDSESKSDGDAVSKLRRMVAEFSWEHPKVFITSNDVWVCRSEGLLCFDLASGAGKKSIPLPGRATQVSRTGNGLLVLSEVSAETNAATRIDLSSSAAKTELVPAVPMQMEQLENKTPAEATLTAGSSMNPDPFMETPFALRKQYSASIPSGDGVVQVKVKLLQANIASIQTMKRPTGKSALNENTSAATSAGVVAEEVFNDIKRSRTGGFRQVDRSRYEVTLQCFPEGASATWSGEVIGPPGFYALETVNILTAGKALYIFDKHNKKIGESQLAHSVGERYLELSGQTGPCCEVEHVLYFFDQGVLTAFDLPSCQVRWRLTTVGVSNVQPDGRGNLYVATTSASPESIQYSDDINITDPAVAILLKIDAASGKIIWKSRRKSDVHLSGKYVYAVNTQISGHPLVSGVSQAFGSGGSGSVLRIYRVDPSNGKEMWESFQNDFPEDVDFCDNRILLRFENEVRILKFLSF